jgi:hemerythrin superfamily protein
MIDPITALSAATAAFNAVKKGVEMGQDIENMAGAIGKWMGAVSDINKSEEFAKKPPLFKKLFASNSVEEEALNAFMAKKKAEDMREQLKQIISATRGPQAWQELIKAEADIRKRRQETIYAQKERQKHFIEIAVIIGATIIGAAAFIFVIWLIKQG